MTAGIGCAKQVTRTPNGEWRVELTPNTDAGRRFIPDQPVVGFGPDEQAASWEAIQAFARAISKLTPEQRVQCEAEEEPLDAEVRLVGAADSEGSVATSDEASAREWAEKRKQERRRSA